MKEAKVNTSWVQPNEQWDAAVAAFIEKILDPSPRNRFLESFLPVAEEVARAGAINSLSQVLLKLTSPGVPDIYQGNEIWDFSLVDPDNRRPVDYQQRREMLDGLAGATPEELLGNWRDGRIKLFLTHRLLTFRRENPELFREGSYVPLNVTGEFAGLLHRVPRASGGQIDRRARAAPEFAVGFPPVGEAWRDTAVQLPEGFVGGEDLFTGTTIDQGASFPLSQAMAQLPFAVVVATLRD